MSEELREALQRAAIGGEPAVGDAFARFAVVKRRAAIARGATVAVIGLAAAATLIFTLPGLNSGDIGGGLTGGDISPPPQARAVKHYEDKIAGFAFDYPAEWEIDAVEGRSVRVRPPGAPDRTSVERVPCDRCPPYRHVVLGTSFIEIAPRDEDTDETTEGGMIILSFLVEGETDEVSRRVGAAELSGYDYRFGDRVSARSAEAFSMSWDPEGENEMLPWPWYQDAVLETYRLEELGLERFLLRSVTREGDSTSREGFDIILRSFERLR